MGVVYLAEDTMLGREVALKILDRAVVASEMFEARMRQEARVVAFLDHPRIVAIHALERIEDELIIEMAYLPGGSLLDAMASGLLSMPRLMRYSADILDALACCHEANIVHRDVKPSNILINHEQRAFLSDFGLARVLSVHPSITVMECSSSCFFLGTPRYAPPEAWQRGKPTSAWDMYSFGAVLYEAISGRTPYEAHSPLELARKMATERPVPLAQAAPMTLSPELLELVDAMVAPNPAERLAHGRAGLDLLRHVPECAAEEMPPDRQFARHFPFRSPAGPLGSRTRLSSRSRRRLRTVFATSLAAGLLILAALAGGSYLYDRHPGAPLESSITGPQLSVYSLLDPAAQTYWPDQCLLRSYPNRDGWEALIAGEQLLWLIQAQQAETGRFTVAGQWAAYEETAGGRFDHGLIRGSCSMVSGPSYALTLYYLNTLTGRETQRSFMLSHRPNARTEEEFFNWLESDTAVSALLYGELQPRGESWVDGVEDLFLARGLQRLSVPQLNLPFSVDLAGESFAAGAGLLPASTTQQEASLAAACSQDSLMLWIDSKGRWAPRSTEFVLSFAAALRPAQMARWHLRAADEVVYFARERGEAVTQLLFPGDFECRQVDKTTWRAVLRIPLVALGLDQAPQPGARWRLNCRIAGPSGREIAVWGAPGSFPVSAVEHGVLLKFLGE
jgi:serine/threonine protein kinase